MRLSTRSVLAGILLTILALSSMGPAGVYLLTTLLTHHHGHEHTVQHVGDDGLVLAHGDVVSEAGLSIASGDHTVPGSELKAAQRRAASTLIQVVTAFAVVLLQPLDSSLSPPLGERQLISASSGPPLFVRHQVFLI